MSTELEQASRQVREALDAHTRALSGDPDGDQVSALGWATLRALANYREIAAELTDAPVLPWLPPLLDLEAGERDRDKVLMFGTWMFAVRDERGAVEGTRGRLADDLDAPVDTASEALLALAEAELHWPDVHAYRCLGLDIEFSEYSAHLLLSAAGDVPADLEARLDGSA